MVAVLNLTTKD